jgi:hypothetical protein
MPGSPLWLDGSGKTCVNAGDAFELKVEKGGPIRLLVIRLSPTPAAGLPRQREASVPLNLTSATLNHPLPDSSIRKAREAIGGVSAFR